MPASEVSVTFQKSGELKDHVLCRGDTETDRQNGRNQSVTVTGLAGPGGI